MGFFGNKGQGVPGQPGNVDIAQMMKMAQEMQQSAMQQQSAIADATAGATVGSMTWARAVMSVIAPPEPGYVKRCTCAVCGAPKKLPSVTAYVYCDHCGSLADYDLRRASESDVPTPAEYPQTVNGLQPQLKAAQAAGDQTTYNNLQKQMFTAFVQYVPNSVSHRAKGDEDYRAKLIDYMAAAATAIAFDPEAVRLTAEMQQKVMGLQYSGSMMATKVSAESFWGMTETLKAQIAHTTALNKANGVADMDPDHASHLAPKLAWSTFCQGWLTMVDDETAKQLLDQAGFTNAYVKVEPETGDDRRCGSCGGNITALPGAKAVVCEGCGHTLDVGAAEIPCTNCGAKMTLPQGASHTACPYCKADVERVGVM